MNDTGILERPAPAATRTPLFWADRVRNLATVMVIAIHVSGAVAQGNTEYDTFFWWSGNFWDSLSRPSVPLFVMLSGFLLLGKDYPLGDFLKRRFSRVVIPAIVWIAVYNYYDFRASGSPASFTHALKGMLERSVHYHLWFIYLIIGLYLVYPILRPWIRSAKEQDYWYFFIAWFVGSLVYKILWVFFSVSIGIYFELFTNNCGYFVMGYYFGNKVAHGQTPLSEGIKPWRLSENQVAWLAVGFIATGTAITAIGTWWASKAYGGTFHPYFYDYLTPNCAISAVGWFLLAKWAWNRRPLLDIEVEFSKASFGIYFIHVLVMDWWSHIGYWQTKIHPMAGVPIMVCLIAVVSFIAISFIRILPGGDKIT